MIERRQAPAQEASGNPAGLLRPVFSLDWNTHSRFTSAAFLYAIRHQTALEDLGDRPDHGEGLALAEAKARAVAACRGVVGKHVLAAHDAFQVRNQRLMTAV